MFKISSRDIATELSKMEASMHRAELINSVDGCLNLSRMASNEGNIFSALYYLDLAIELDSSNSTVLKEKAKVLILIKDYKEALETVEYLLEIDPSNADAQAAREILLKKINYTKLVTAHPLYS